MKLINFFAPLIAVSILSVAFALLSSEYEAGRADISKVEAAVIAVKEVFIQGTQENKDVNREDFTKHQILVAIDQNDLAWCEQLADLDSSQKCQETILRIQALNESDTAKCENINSDYEMKACFAEVYFSKALSQFDKSFCEKIEIETVRERCLNNFSKTSA